MQWPKQYQWRLLLTCWTKILQSPSGNPWCRKNWEICCPLQVETSGIFSASDKSTWNDDLTPRFKVKTSLRRLCDVIASRWRFCDVMTWPRRLCDVMTSRWRLCDVLTWSRRLCDVMTPFWVDIVASRLCNVTTSGWRFRDVMKSFLVDSDVRRSCWGRSDANWAIRTSENLSEIVIVNEARVWYENCLVPRPRRSTWLEELMNGLLIH